MPDVIGTMTVDIEANTSSYEEAINKLGSSADDIGSKFKDIGSKIMGVGAGLTAGLTAPIVAVGAALGGLVADAAKFHGSMNEVFTLLPGISQQAMDDMTQQVQDFGVEFGRLPEETVPALYQALSSGVPQDNVFQFLEVATKAAEGGCTDLTVAVDGISSVVNAYGSDVLSAEQASDMMFTTVRLGKTNFEQLSAAIFNCTPTASALGVSFADVSAALATITLKGVPTSVATTQLRAMMLELGDATKGVGQVFQELAGKDLTTFISEGGNLQQALAMLETKAKESGLNINQMFSSVEAGSASLNLAGESASVFADNIDAMKNSMGATQGAFDTMNSSLVDSWDDLLVVLQIKGQEIGEALLPLAAIIMETFVNNVLPAIEGLLGALQGVFTWFSQLPGGIQLAVVAFFALLAAIGPVLVIVAAVVSAVGTLIPVVTAAGAAIMGLSAPIVAVIALVGVFIAFLVSVGTAVYQFVSTNEEAQGKIVQIWQMLQKAIEPIFNGLKAFWAAWGDEITTIFSTAWEIIQIAFEATILNIMDGIIAFIALFTGDWDTFASSIKTIWDRSWAEMAAIVGLIWSKMSPYFTELWSSINTWFTSLVTDAISWGENFINGIVDGIRNNISKVAQAASDAVDAAAQYIGFNSPAKKGEGRYIVQWGENMIGGFAEGINNAIPALSDLMGYVIPDLGNNFNNGSNITTYEGARLNQQITINSPTALNAAEVARKVKMASRDLALEWQ